jgi:hypothetical protein
MIKGKARVGTTDLMNAGDYYLCSGLGDGLYDRPLARDTVVPAKTKLYGSITFDNVLIELDTSLQDKPIVVLQLGAIYNFGSKDGKLDTRDGSINVGGVIQGNLTLKLNVQDKVTRDIGTTLPRLPFDAEGTPRTSVIGVFESGIHRTDMTKLSLTIESKRKDNDDIGILHHHSWGVSRGPTRIEKLGIGALFYGNSTGSITNSYIHRNSIGIMLGDFENAGSIVFARNCVNSQSPTSYSDACKTIKAHVTGLVVADSVIEGNSHGNLVINDGSRIDFRSVHFEMSLRQYQSGHGILIGGGLCRAEAVALYGRRSECGQSRAFSGPKGAMIDGIRFNGGFISGDRSSPIWDSVVIGENANFPRGSKDSTSLVFNTFFRESLDSDRARSNLLGALGEKSMLIKNYNRPDINIDFTGSRYKAGVVESLSNTNQ